MKLVINDLQNGYFYKLGLLVPEPDVLFFTMTCNDINTRCNDKTVRQTTFIC